MLSSEFFNFT